MKDLRSERKDHPLIQKTAESNVPIAGLIGFSAVAIHRLQATIRLLEKLRQSVLNGCNEKKWSRQVHASMNRPA